MVIAYVLFFLVGLAFGYALRGPTALLALAFPILIAIPGGLNQGFDSGYIARLLVALALTAGGLILGWVLDQGTERRSGGTAKAGGPRRGGGTAGA
jgi:hypothetical protein